MEPTTSLVTALAARSGDAALDVAKEEAKGFLRQLFGPSAEAIGADFALRHRERLFKNMVDVLARAKDKLKAAGVSPREVPLKIIHPMLEAASLEEEPHLQDVWANLLTNTADPRQEQPLTPSFREILKELTTREVKFLECLVEAVSERLFGQVHADIDSLQFTDDDLSRIYRRTGLTRAAKPLDEIRSDQEYWDNRSDYIADANDFAMALQIILRNRLLMEHQHSTLKAHDIAKNFNLEPVLDVPVDTKLTYSLTHLGIAFLRACRDPASPLLAFHKGCFDHEWAVASNSGDSAEDVRRFRRERDQ